MSDQQESTGYQQLIQVLYRKGLLLTADLCNIAQDYVTNLMRNQNLALFSSGVIQGLSVSGANTTTITVDTGMALDSSGQSIVLSSAITLPVTSANDGTIYISIQYQATPNQIQHVTVENPQIQLLTAPPTDPHLQLATANIQGGIITSITDTRSYITLNADIRAANNIPSTLTAHFSVSVSTPADTTTAVQSFLLTYPTPLAFTPAQLVISVQDPSNGQAVFSACITTVSTTQFGVNILFTPNGTTTTWPTTLIINGIAWAASTTSPNQ